MQRMLRAWSPDQHLDPTMVRKDLHIAPVLQAHRSTYNNLGAAIMHGQAAIKQAASAKRHMPCVLMAKYGRRLLGVNSAADLDSGSTLATFRMKALPTSMKSRRCLGGL